MKKLAGIVLIALFSQFALAQSEVAKNVSVLLKAGNASELASKFNANINLAVLDDEVVASRAQGEQILKDFFAKNSTKDFNIIHQGTSKSGMEYIIGNLTTAGNSYRVTYYISKVGDKFYVKELRIEEGDD